MTRRRDGFERMLLAAFMQTVVAEVDFEVDATSERHSLKTEVALDLESCEVPVDHGKFINSKILILKK